MTMSCMRKEGCANFIIEVKNNKISDSIRVFIFFFERLIALP